MKWVKRFKAGKISRRNMGKKRFRMMWVILSVIVLSALVGVVFVNMPQFGRLARIERSAHYRDGEFRNLHETVLMTSGKGFFQNLTGFLFRKQAGLRPDSTLPVIKTDLQTLNLSEDLLVWFGCTCFVRKQTFQRNGGVPAGRYARYRLPDHYPRSLGSFGLPDSDGFKRSCAESGMSVGGR